MEKNYIIATDVENAHNINTNKQSTKTESEKGLERNELESYCLVLVWEDGRGSGDRWVVTVVQQCEHT